jgi:hypothetical protein
MMNLDKMDPTPSNGPKRPLKIDPNPQGRPDKKTPFKLKLGSPSPMYNKGPMKSRLGCGSLSPIP